MSSRIASLRGQEIPIGPTKVEGRDDLDFCFAVKGESERGLVGSLVVNCSQLPNHFFSVSRQVNEGREVITIKDTVEEEIVTKIEKPEEAYVPDIDQRVDIEIRRTIIKLS